MANKVTVRNYVSGLWCLTMESGKTYRTLHDVYAYDENGIIGRAHTNEDEWEFTTKRSISTRAIKEPDFKRKDGFLVKEIALGTVRYDLYIRMDNLPTDECVEWKKSRVMPGAIFGGFKVGDCTFGTFRLNKRFRDATDDARSNLKWCEREHYLKSISIWPSMSIQSIEERIRVFDAISNELHRLYDLALELDNESLETLIAESV